jgi:hypothetical protein
VGNPLFRRPIEGMHRDLEDRNPTPNCPNQNLHLKLISHGFDTKVEDFRKRVTPET